MSSIRKDFSTGEYNDALRSKLNDSKAALKKQKKSTAINISETPMNTSPVSVKTASSIVSSQSTVENNHVPTHSY